MTRCRGAHDRAWHALAAMCCAIGLMAGPMARASHGSQAGEVDRDSAAGKPLVRFGPNQRVTLHLTDVPLVDALRLLTEPAKRNVVLASGVTGTVSVSMYDVAFQEALDAILLSNGLGYSQEGVFIYVHPVEELAKLSQAKRKSVSRVFRLSYMNAAAAKDLITPLLTPDVGKIATTPPANVGLGGETGIPDTTGNALAGTDILIVSDYEDRMEEIAKVIKDLDVRPRQVLVEATILRAALNEDNTLGIDFTTVGGIDFTTLNSTSLAAQSITTGNTPLAELGNTTFTARTDFNAALPGGGFTFGIIKDQVGVFIRALEAITDTEVLANPKLLALNKQVAQVIIGRRDGYLTTTFTETLAIQTVEFLETGTVLSFRPFIGEDDVVRMEIHPKDSTGGLTQANLPFEQTTEVTTNILVRDGHTILIGGLFREVTTATRGQVPGLGNIPFAGALFRSTNDNTIREEVIILLTVHIVKDDADTEASEKLYEDVERFRVGMRRGLQWLGRERLAQVHYRWATQHLARGDIDKALWDARLALHNNPQSIDASKLIETVTQRRAWESEASAVRSFIQHRIAEENGITIRPFDRPMPPFEIPEVMDGPIGFEDVDPPTDVHAAPSDADSKRGAVR